MHISIHLYIHLSLVTEVSSHLGALIEVPGLCRSCRKHDGQNPNQRLPSLASRGVDEPRVTPVVNVDIAKWKITMLKREIK